MDRAISEYGTCVLSAVDENDLPVLWCLILEDNYESATELLEFAKENRILVTFRGAEDDDLLWRAIADNSVECVKFVLDKLVERFTSLEETCFLLNFHFRRLVDEFPDLMWDYLQKDKFTIEYARFKIPKYLFVRKDSRLGAGLLTSHRLKDWETTEGDEPDEFWLSEPEEFWLCYLERGIKIVGTITSVWFRWLIANRESTDTKITVVAKFFCISYCESRRETG